MKKRALKIILVILSGVFSHLYATSLVTLTNSSIVPAPLDSVEKEGKGVITFTFKETSGETAPAIDTSGNVNIEISVELNKLGLINDSILSIRGTLLTYFNISYNVQTHKIIFKQKADFPALMEVEISIPVNVLENSMPTDKSLNGFNAYILANDISTTAKGNISSFTYTKMTVPDYKSILTVYGGIVYGVGVHKISFDTLVKNLISDTKYNPSKPLKILIPKNRALSLHFDSTLTSFKGEIVQNSLWDFDSTSDIFDYIMTYKGNSMLTGISRFAIEGTFTVKEGEVGKFLLETTIQSGTGGDININNNTDRETLQKRL